MANYTYWSLFNCSACCENIFWRLFVFKKRLHKPQSQSSITTSNQYGVHLKSLSLCANQSQFLPLITINCNFHLKFEEKNEFFTNKFVIVCVWFVNQNVKIVQKVAASCNTSSRKNTKFAVTAFLQDCRED